MISTVCLFVLLGGGAYAATRLPAKSVGTAQLKGGAVTGAKIKDGTITGAKIDSRTLGPVPSALSAGSAATATSATRATTAASADRATSAASADRAAEATHAERATIADNAEFLGGNTASNFVNTDQLGYIDKSFSGCTLSVQCPKNVTTVAGVTFESGCEYNGGVAAVFIKVIAGSGSRTGYSYVREGTQARNGRWEGDNSVAPAVATGPEAVSATGLVMVRTPARIISMNFDATARLPVPGSASCTVAATALAV